MNFRVCVVGEPAPQGSKRHVGKGVLIESSKKVAPWRKVVTAAATAQMKKDLLLTLRGPVVVNLDFYLRKPKKPKFPLAPATYPDLDKLVRSTLDAIVMAGVIEDDGRVIRIATSKAWTEKTPGVVIEVSRA